MAISVAISVALYATLSVAIFIAISVDISMALCLLVSVHWFNSAYLIVFIYIFVHNRGRNFCCKFGYDRIYNFGDNGGKVVTGPAYHNVRKLVMQS